MSVLQEFLEFYSLTVRVHNRQFITDNGLIKSHYRKLPTTFTEKHGSPRVNPAPTIEHFSPPFLKLPRTEMYTTAMKGVTEELVDFAYEKQPKSL